MQRILFATAVTLAALAARPAVCAPSPEARYEAAVKVLSGCQYCEGIRDTPEDLDALNAAWTATQDWTVEYLNAHPNTTAEKLRTVFLNGHPGYQPLPAEGHLVYVPQQAAPDDVTRLGPDLFGFGAGNGTGNVFLVAKRDGRFQVVWDVRNLPGDQISKFPVLTAWSAVGARGSCRSKANEGKWNQCGPIGGSFERLPPDAQGHLRFYLTSTYAQLVGETVSGQISIWSWDGSNATPLLAGSYTYDLEDDVGARFSHGLVKVRTKDEYQSYYSCGACLGRQMDWTVSVDPGRVTDLGLKPLNPELDMVDALFQRIEKRQDTGDLASPSAVSKLKDIIAPTWDETANPPKFDLGMIGYSTVHRARDQALACISIDAFDNGLAFTLEKRNAKTFITDVALLPSREDGKC